MNEARLVAVFAIALAACDRSAPRTPDAHRTDTPESTRATSSAQSVPETSVRIVGQISPVVVRQEIGEYRARFRECAPTQNNYDTVVKFDISTTGLVHKVSVVGAASTASCLAGVAKDMTFPRPPKTVHVEYTVQ